jgi:RNA polymerase-binding transcription factor DksA
MDKKELQRYRRVLEQLAARMQSDATAVTDQVCEGSGGQAGGGLSNAPMHLGDMGTEEYLQDLNATLLEHEEYLTNEARAALGRIDDGTFGKCETCGKAIPKERLDALPYARHCAPCAEKASTGPPSNLNRGRPQRPADTLAPQGEMDESGRRRARGRGFDAQRGSVVPSGDAHAAGTPGGGTALGGLAGSNEGRGEPDIADLQDAMGNGNFESQEEQAEDERTPKSGRSGGAVGGTPAGKRTRGENPPSK